MRLIPIGIFLVLYLLLSVPIMLVLLIVRQFQPKKAELIMLRIVQWAFKVVMFIAGTDITTIGLEKIPDDEGMLFVANHQGVFDILIGYSQGAAGALCALTNYENGKRYRAIFTGSAAYPTLAKNMGWEYDASKVTVPYFMCAGTGRSDDSGADPEKSYGGVSPLSALIANYDSIADDVPKIRARAVGAEHEQMLARSDGYMTAWMLFQLTGNEEAGIVFLGENAEILQNKNWQDVEKNR